jgi:hypothetical protein
MYINYCNLHEYSRVPLPLSVDRLRALPGHLPLSRFTLYRSYLLYGELRREVHRSICKLSANMALEPEENCKHRRNG